MIAKLTGRVDGLVDGGCILDVNGVGYLVACSTRTASALPPAPERAVVLVETQARENAIALYGFADEHASLADRGYPVVLLWAGLQAVAVVVSEITGRFVFWWLEPHDPLRRHRLGRSDDAVLRR